MKIRSDIVNEIETPQPEESLSENGQGRRTLIKHVSKAVYVAPVLFVLSQNAFGREAPGKSAPGRTPPGRTMNDISVTPPPPP